MNVFEAILSPFVFVIKQFFLFGYHITGNYGWAIILLSFLISLLLLPLFIYIEREKKKTDAVKRKMKPVEDEIKRVYKGQERYYYLRTLHRQHGYSQFKAMIPILSLLLQIPFFIAAYQFLEHYEPLQGVAFGIIKDLSKPDHILGAINLLPVAMTVVNLVTAWFYTRFGDKSERKQMLVIALVFLVLLYNLPSGLVLYWTMNNVFSFFRLFVTNPEVFKNINKKEIKEEIKKLSIKPFAFYSLLFFSVYFYLSAIFYYSGFNTTLALLAVVTLIPVESSSFRNILKSKRPAKTVVFLILVIFLIQAFQLYSIISGKTFSFLPFTGNPYSGFIITGLVAVLLMLPHYVKINKVTAFSKIKPNLTVFLLSVLYLTGFIFLWNPLSIYSSYPDNFVFPAIDILKENIDLFLYFTVGAAILYFILPHGIKKVLYILILLLTAIGFINNTLFPINVGSLQETKFLLESNLAKPVLSYILEGSIIIFVFWGIIKLTGKVKSRYLVITLLLLNIVLISNSLYDSFNTKVFFAKPGSEIKSSHKISFSKDKENVIFIISDMFYGWYMKKIIEESPELKKDLSGFVWYPNTLSISAITATSIPPILGGYDFTVDKLNKDKYHTLTEKMTRITEKFYDRVKQQGYRFTSTDMIYSKIDRNKFDSYLPHWDESWNVWNKKLKTGSSIEIGYSLLWENAAFYTAPLFLKPVIYNKGKWLAKDSGNKGSRENTNSAKRYNFLRLLPYISDTLSEKPSFIYIHSMASHHPWCYVDDDGIMHDDVIPYENNKWVIKTFAKWFEWMKENGVYDNTKIVLLSDHGIHWWFYEGEADTTIPLKNINSIDLGIDMSMVKAMFPLLLVKDFNKNETLHEDWRFMSNADASYIAFNKENPTNINYKKERELPSFMTIWKRKMGDRKYIEPVYSIIAEGSAFDLSKWKKFDPDTVQSNVLEKLFNGNTGSLKFSKKQEIDAIKRRIRDDQEWYKKIKAKARKNRRTVEEQLERDAEWIYKKENKNK